MLISKGSTRTQRRLSKRSASSAASFARCAWRLSPESIVVIRVVRDDVGVPRV